MKTQIYLNRCKIILDGVSENMFEYETDGLKMTLCDGKSGRIHNIGKIIAPKKVIL